LHLLNSFDGCEEIAANKAGLRLIAAIRKFTEILITHLNEKVGEVAVDYFTSVSVFAMENLPS
jgi:hypothetical protein